MNYSALKIDKRVHNEIREISKNQGIWISKIVEMMVEDYKKKIQDEHDKNINKKG